MPEGFLSDGGLERAPAKASAVMRAGTRSRRAAPDDNPLAVRSGRLLALFQLYLHWYFWRSFSGVRLSRGYMPPDETGRPIVVFTNHPSWWDPIMMMLISPKLFPRRLGFGPIDAQALRRYGLFRKFGVFGVEPGTRGAARFLRTAKTCLEEPRAIMWITAEGSFTDPRRRPLMLRPGLAHLARHVPDAVFMPAAFDYVFWNESRPEALVRFGPPVSVAHLAIDDAQAVLTEALTATLDALAGDGGTRDARRFVTLLHGAGGVSAIYDVWRRLLAFSRGQRFDPRHEPPRS